MIVKHYAAPGAGQLTKEISITMDIKLLQSKINLLTAQQRQLVECGYFNDEEIARLSRPMKIEMAQLQPQLNELHAAQDVKEFDVYGHEIVS